MTRKQLNHKIRALAHGVLGLSEEEYRAIVSNVDPRSEGHITRCDDEDANLVYMQLKKMTSMASGIVRLSAHDEVRQHHGVKTNAPQHRMIARLMDHLRWKWSDTASFCHKITGHRTTRLCNAAELSKIIRGMIAIIDSDIEKGKISLSHTAKFDYERHVKHHRAPSLSPPQGENL